MRCLRVAVPVLVLSVAVVALGRSHNRCYQPCSFLHNLQPGDSITLGAPGNAGTYAIRVLTDEQLKDVNERAEQYTARMSEYRAKRQERRELMDRLQREKDPQKRSELTAKLREETSRGKPSDPSGRSSLARPPSRPDPVYQVSMIGGDYVALRGKSIELLVPAASIRSIRRTLASPQD